MFEIYPIVVTAFQQNARILGCLASKQAVVIDPGGDVDKILKKLDETGFEVGEIWLTHSHADHCGGVAGLQARTGAKLYGHRDEAFMRKNLVELCRMLGVPPGDIEDCPEPDVFISGGETLSLGEFAFEVLCTPGHSPGHVCFYHRESGTLIAGDTLFSGSIGRTDLPGSDHGAMMHTLLEVLMTLPDETNVLPGHGPDTTIGRERRANPFIVGELNV